MSLLSWLGFETTEERLQKIEQQELARQERRKALDESLKKEQQNTPIFQVGTTEDGRVTLRVSNYAGWVTMTDAGVDQLINMLQAAKGLPAEITDETEEE